MLVSRRLRSCGRLRLRGRAARVREPCSLVGLWVACVSGYPRDALEPRRLPSLSSVLTRAACADGYVRAGLFLRDDDPGLGSSRPLRSPRCLLAITPEPLRRVPAFGLPRWLHSSGLSITAAL